MAAGVFICGRPIHYLNFPKVCTALPVEVIYYNPVHWMLPIPEQHPLHHCFPVLITCHAAFFFLIRIFKIVGHVRIVFCKKYKIIESCANLSKAALLYFCFFKTVHSPKGIYLKFDDINVSNLFLI